MKKELVVARYQENIRWVYRTSESIDSIIVYNKGDSIQAQSERVKIVELPNAGREAHSYIHHFLHNRAALADITLVCQANPFEHSDRFGDRLALDYTELKSLSVRYMHDWPFQNVTSKDKVEEYKGFQIRLGDMKYFGHRDKVETRKWFEHIWSTMFIDPCPEEYYYGYSAMWAIPRNLILNRSIKFWEYYYDLLSHQVSNEAYVCSIDAWAMEALWHAIFTPKYRTIL